ncbi:hypothetical protein D044_1571A, partial [Vibrio parahaemolyticus EKP-026]
MSHITNKNAPAKSLGH